MSNTSHRYSSEYDGSPCFWGTQPASYVRLFAALHSHDLSELQVLDLGAGEGKNAVYLASLGAEVLGIDLSAKALGRFPVQPGYEAAKDRLSSRVADASKIDFRTGEFDAVVAYGLLHCFDNVSEIDSVVRKIKSWIRRGGHFVGATFTDTLPVPPPQAYLSEEALLPAGYLQRLFADWRIIAEEDDVISEVHPTSNVEHQHSICRLIAQRP